MPFVILTGLSGAGKTQAIDAFEDAGYFCVDNLPPQLLSTLVDLVRLEGSKVSKVAVVSDVRGGEYFRELERVLDELRGPASSSRWSFSRRRTRRSCGASRRLAAGIRWPGGAPSSRASTQERRPARDAARARPPHHRHQRDQDPAAEDMAQRRDHPSRAAPEPGLHVRLVRLQVRRAHRRRTAVRRPLPAQPVLRPRAAAAHRPRPAGARLRRRLGRLRGVRRRF